MRHLDDLGRYIKAYQSLPFFDGSVPGKILETLVAFAFQGRVLNTLDFVDVVSGKVGWQVKSIKAGSDVTWKRVTIANPEFLLELSYEEPAFLGRYLIDICNDHIFDSFVKYGLEDIRYIKAEIHPSNVVLVEKSIVTNDSIVAFDHDDFYWHWTEPKHRNNKELLPSFSGFHKETNSKWFSWNGLGDNQFRFTYEKVWAMEGAVSKSISTEDVVSVSLEELIKRVC